MVCVARLDRVHRLAEGLHRQGQRAGTPAGAETRPRLAAPDHRVFHCRRRAAAAPDFAPGARKRPAHRRRRRIRVLSRARLRDRRARLVVRVADDHVRTAGNRPVRHGLGRRAVWLSFRDAVRARARGARPLQRRRIHRRLGGRHRRVGGGVHVLSGHPHPAKRHPGSRRRIVGPRVFCPDVHREDLGRRLPRRRRPLRGRLEHARAGALVRSRMHLARARLCADRQPHRFSLQAPVACAVGAADHHSALRDRAWPDSDLRPLGTRQPVSRMGLRHCAVALDLRPARRADGADFFVHTHCLSGLDRCRRGRVAEHGGSRANAACQPLAHVRRRFAAADAPRIGQRISDQLHRVHRRLR